MIKSGVLDWLLEHENPSVRYWTLLNLKKKGKRHKDVLAAEKAIMMSPIINAILEGQSPKGNWGPYENMYHPKYRGTTHTLLILAELGASRNKKIEQGIEHLFLFQRNSGHFLIGMPKTDKGRNSAVTDGCCLDGNILYYLTHFGYLDDPRTQKLLSFMADDHSEAKGGWLCRAYPIDAEKVFPANCYMGSVKALRALANIPINKRSKAVQRVIHQEVENVLSNQLYKYLRNKDGSRKAKAGWLRFGFPLFYQSDLLEVMDTLTSLGVKDPRMDEAINIINSYQNADGKWLLKNTYNGKFWMDIEEKHKPSKWITYRALKVLMNYR